MAVGDAPRAANVDPEEEHERDEADIAGLIRKLEAQEEAVRQASRGSGASSPGALAPRALASLTPLGRLTEYKNKLGDISSVLAFADVTGMKLEVGKVKEARSKEIQYVRDMRVYDKIPRSQAQRQGWKVVKTRWIDINKGGDENPN